ncbi:S-ribosylhomocysteine lyase, partial [Clostridioides difficile]
VPGTDIYSCGNYRDHSLFSAKEWAKKILADGISVQPFERNVI